MAQAIFPCIFIPQSIVEPLLLEAKVHSKEEEVPVKRMGRPSAPETERGRASETDRPKRAKNMEMPLK